MLRVPQTSPRGAQPTNVMRPLMNKPLFSKWPSPPVHLVTPPCTDDRPALVPAPASRVRAGERARPVVQRFEELISLGKRKAKRVRLRIEFWKFRLVVDQPEET